MEDNLKMEDDLKPIVTQLDETGKMTSIFFRWKATLENFKWKMISILFLATKGA